MSDIPPGVIDNILTRLPVKSLLTFRCVSKSWKALIDSPNFIQAHLKRQQLLKSNSDFKLFLEGKALFSLDCGSICSNTELNQPQELDHPLKLPDVPSYVLGSCHGLVLISNKLNGNVLWNPSTKMFRKLPFCPIKDPVPQVQGRLSQFCGGFGYDSSGDDYKVVKISQWYHVRNRSFVSETMVYHLKLDLWNKVQEECPYWLVEEDIGTLAGGALYWIACKGPDSPMVLINFDLGNERFQEVPYPENLGKPSQLNLAVLGESLCLLSGHNAVHNNAKNCVLDHVDIWVMDYGVKESWTKLFSVEQLVGRQHFSVLRPITYSVMGREVLLEMDRSKFLWYNLEKKSLKHAKIRGGLDSFETFVCLETLVPLYGGGNEKDRKEKIEAEIEDGAKNNEEGDAFVIWRMRF